MLVSDKNIFLCHGKLLEKVSMIIETTFELFSYMKLCCLRLVKLILIAFVFFSILPDLYARKRITDEGLEHLLLELDNELKDSGRYVESRLQNIDFLRRMYGMSASSDEIIYDINKRMYDEYLSFQFDSALFYVTENLHLAEKMGDWCRKADMTVELGHLYTISGMYLEAREVLTSKIDTSHMDKESLVHYYFVQNRFYEDFEEYSKNPAMTEMLQRRRNWYCSKLLSLLPEDSPVRMETAMKKAVDDKDFERADSINLSLLGMFSQDSHEYAVYAYWQAIIDYALGRETYLHWYTRSAIADVKTATKDHASLTCLARQLFEDRTDLERAFRYITVSLDDAIWYNAKLRPWQVAQILPLIEKSYNERMESVDRVRNILNVCLGVSAMLLLLFASWSYYTYRRMRSKAEYIDRMNARIRVANEELKAMNARLSELNSAVSEANSIKEEYIALFLTMCSDYIDKMLGFQQDIKRKLTVGMGAELQNELSSSKLMKQELDNFYNMFDTAFLKLYPDFVEEFNGLLREEERIVLPKDALLNTELRIFALMRLGISNSTRISTLLRYSVQTIYNYRQRMKKRSKFDPDDFEKQVMEIGQYKR